MEEKIIGRETTVGILGGQALPVAEVRVKKGNFDYKNKYTPGAAEHFCPADFAAATTAGFRPPPWAHFTPWAGAITRGWMSWCAPTAIRWSWKSTPCPA